MNSLIPSRLTLMYGSAQGLDRSHYTRSSCNIHTGTGIANGTSCQDMPAGKRYMSPRTLIEKWPHHNPLGPQ